MTEKKDEGAAVVAVGQKKLTREVRDLATKVMELAVEVMELTTEVMELTSKGDGTGR